LSRPERRFSSKFGGKLPVYFLAAGNRLCDQVTMGILHKSAASIGFYGDDLDPAEITAALGANPTVGVSKGGQWKTKSGAVKTAVIGSWRIEAEYCEPGDLDSQINGLLDGLSDDLVAWRSLHGDTVAVRSAGCSSLAETKV
jgi:hypothetical protein